MIAYAEHVARRGNKSPPLPAGVEHIWNWFCALAGTRGNNGYAPLPITFLEIAAWASLSAAQPSPWEVDLIRRVDAAVLQILNKKQGGADEPEIEVAADDEIGVKSIFASLKARANAAFGKKA